MVLVPWTVATVAAAFAPGLRDVHVANHTYTEDQELLPYLERLREKAIRDNAANARVWNKGSAPSGPNCGPLLSTMISKILEEVADEVNESLASLIVNGGYDPWNGMAKDKVFSLKDQKGLGCIEFCATEMGICKDYWLKIKEVDLEGLSSIKLKKPELTQCTTFENGGKCPCGDPGQLDTGVKGEIATTATADLSFKINVKDGDGGVHAKCASPWKTDEYLIWGGAIKCTLKDLEVTMKNKPCGGKCKGSNDEDKQNVCVRCMETESISVKHDNFTCEVDGDGGQYINTLIQKLSPIVEDTLLKALLPLAVKTLNDGVMDKALDFFQVLRVCDVPSKESLFENKAEFVEMLE